METTEVAPIIRLPVNKVITSSEKENKRPISLLTFTLPVPFQSLVLVNAVVVCG
jgi:hypothetical protein